MPLFQSLTLYVVRHGECEHNVEGRLAGHDDSPLTALGCEQANITGRTLARIAGDLSTFDFYTSSLHRACRTMGLLRVAAGLSISGYLADRRLMELNYGDHSGQLSSDVSKRADYALYRTDPWNYVRPNGESIAVLHKRVADFLNTLRRNAIIVCHHGSAKMVRANYLDSSAAEAIHYQIPHAGIMVLSNRGEQIVFGDANS